MHTIRCTYETHGGYFQQRAAGARQQLESMSIDELKGHKVVKSSGDELG